VRELAATTMITCCIAVHSDSVVTEPYALAAR